MLELNSLDSLDRRPSWIAWIDGLADQGAKLHEPPSWLVQRERLVGVMCRVVQRMGVHIYKEFIRFRDQDGLAAHLEEAEYMDTEYPGYEELDLDLELVDLVLEEKGGYNEEVDLDGFLSMADPGEAESRHPQQKEQAAPRPAPAPTAHQQSPQKQRSE